MVTKGLIPRIPNAEGLSLGDMEALQLALICTPEKLGFSMGGRFFSLAKKEDSRWHCRKNGTPPLSLAASSVPAFAIIQDGRHELIERFVRPFAANRDSSWIDCWVLSEPRHGSDRFLVGSHEFRYPTSSPQTVAGAEGANYVVEGRKTSWIAN
jgi:hypothetical protein